MIIKKYGIQKITYGKSLVVPSDIVCAEIDGIDCISQKIKDEKIKEG